VDLYWPYKNTSWRITQWFNQHPYKDGLDIGAPCGTPILCAQSALGGGLATVSFAGWSSIGYGNLVIVAHGGGWQTYYAHMEKILVKKGQKVLAGAVLGKTGTTGNSTGCHLHLGAQLNGNFKDPWPMLYHPLKSPPEESVTPPPVSNFRGIDVSKWQGNINFAKAKQEGLSFVILRTGDGADVKDEKFNEYYTEAKAAGLMIGAYHYMRFHQSEAGVLANMLSMLDGKTLDLPLALDVEENNGKSKDQVKSWLINFVFALLDQQRNRFTYSATYLDWNLRMYQQYYKKFHDHSTNPNDPTRYPAIYTSASKWSQYVSSMPEWEYLPLWIAHWTNSTLPVIPNPWPWYTIHQYGQVNGSIFGVSSSLVDVDRWNGSPGFPTPVFIEDPDPPPPPPPPPEEDEVLLLKPQIKINNVLYQADSDIILRKV